MWRVSWSNRPFARGDVVWALLLICLMLAWATSIFWLLTSMNVDSSFEPIGSLSEELHACKSVHGIGEAAATVGSNLARKSKIWAILYKHIELPIGALVAIILLSCLWLVALQSCGYIAVWMTMLIKSAALVALGVRFEDYGFTSASHSCYMIGFGLALITVWQYKRINLTAQILQKVGQSLQETGWQTWAAAAILQALFALVFLMFAFASVSSFFVWELRRNNTGHCVLERSSMAQNIQTLSALAFAWASAFLRSGRLLVVASSTVCWYYPPNAVGAAPKHPAFRALEWTFSSSFGTVSLAGLISALASKAEEAATTRNGGCCSDSRRFCSCNCLNPIGLIYQLMWYMLESFTMTASRFALIAHLFIGHDFWRSAHLAFQTMEMRGVVGGYVVGQAGESVVTMGAYVFALVLGMLAWEYVDGIEEFHTLSQAAQTMSGEVLFYLLFIVYMLLTYYPILSLMLSVIFSDFLPEFMTPFLTGLFVACGAHLLFGFLGEVMLAALNAIYFCYCIDLDEARRRHTRRRGGKEKIALGELFEQLEENEGFPPRPSAPPLATSGHYERGYREEDVENKWVPPSNMARGGRGTSYGGGGEQERKAATGGRPSAPPLDDDLPAGTVMGSERTQKKYDTFD